MTPCKNSLLWSLLACSVSILALINSPFIHPQYSVEWPTAAVIVPAFYAGWMITLAQIGCIAFSAYLMMPSHRTNFFDDSFTQSISLISLLFLVGVNFFENAMPFGTELCALGIALLSGDLFRKALQIKRTVGQLYATVPFSILAATAFITLIILSVNVCSYYKWIEKFSVLQGAGLLATAAISISAVWVSSRFREPLFAMVVSWFLMATAFNDSSAHPIFAFTFSASAVILFAWAMHLVNKKNYYQHFENLFQRKHITVG